MESVLSISDSTSWKESVEDAIWENTGLPVMLTVDETRALLENDADIAVPAEVFFLDFTGIVTPKIKKGEARDSERKECKRVAQKPNIRFRMAWIHQGYEKRMGKHLWT